MRDISQRILMRLHKQKSIHWYSSWRDVAKPRKGSGKGDLKYIHTLLPLPQGGFSEAIIYS